MLALSIEFSNRCFNIAGEITVLLLQFAKNNSGRIYILSKSRRGQSKTKQKRETTKSEYSQEVFRALKSFMSHQEAHLARTRVSACVTQMH